LRRGLFRAGDGGVGEIFCEGERRSRLEKINLLKKINKRSLNLDDDLNLQTGGFDFRNPKLGLEYNSDGLAVCGVTLS